MRRDEETRAATKGDRAVAIASVLALLLAGLFGDEPDAYPQPAPGAVEHATPGERARGG